MTSNWRISSGTCLLQNSCNTQHIAVSVIFAPKKHPLAYITRQLQPDMRNFCCASTACFAFKQYFGVDVQK
jgi:hypothetical protein